MNNKPFSVLLAEDNEHDIFAVKRAWKRGKILNPLFVVKDGEECLNYLNRKDKFSDENLFPFPGILLLDINMPKVDGPGVLANIRKNEIIKLLPVVMLTTSQAEEDRLKSYSLGANAYIVKPVGFENLVKALNNIHLFWQMVELPYQSITVK